LTKSINTGLKGRCTWVYLEYLFGKHDVDMFAFDSNAMVDYNGVTLEHFTPMSSPFSAGIDAFSQCYVETTSFLTPEPL
jgi:hypothetical protein